MFILGGTKTTHVKKLLFMGYAFPIPVGPDKGLKLNAQPSAEVAIRGHKDHPTVSR
jgi:hypothetical protein